MKKSDVARDTLGRVQDLFTLWLAVAEAGVVHHRALRDWLEADPGIKERHEGLATSEARARFAVRLHRDLELLQDAQLILKEPEHNGSWYCPGPFAPGLYLAGRRHPIDPAGLEALRELKGERVPTPWERELEAALADLGAACGHMGPGERLIKHLQSLMAANLGRNNRPTGLFAYRSLLPSFKASLERIDDAHWATLYQAMRERRQLRIKQQRGAALLIQPRRIVWYNGRPRLEGYTRRGPHRRIKLVPLHRLTRVELLDTFEDPAQALTPQEAVILDRAWGLDASEDLSHQPRPLQERLTRVVLHFNGSAISSIEDDPGTEHARTERLIHEGHALLRYEVETIIGPHFRRWVRSWGPEVEVIAPDWLRSDFATEAHQVAQHYEVSALR